MCKFKKIGEKEKIFKPQKLQKLHFFLGFSKDKKRKGLSIVIRENHSLIIL